MFDNLRNNLLKLIMFSISAITVVVFVVIFLISKQTTDINNRNKLASLAQTPRGYMTDYSGKGRGNGPNQLPMGEMSMDDSQYFVIQVDVNQSILSIHSLVGFSTNQLELIKEVILSNPKDYSRIQFENQQWMVLQSQTNNRTQFAFLNVTESHNSLRNLLITLSSGLLISLALIYWVAKRFSDRAVEPVEESFNKQKQFIQDASHELKTPLAVIKSNLDIISSNQEKTISDQEKWLKTISYETTRMNTLINEMLKLAQSEYSHQVDIEQVNMSHLVHHVLLSFEALAYENQLKIQSDIKESIIHNTDKEKIRQILTILVDNAIKYSPENGLIKISLKNDSFSIINQNETLSDDDLQHLFERFYKSDSARTRNDSYGLGLSIAKNLAMQCQHDLSVKRFNEKEIIFKIKF